MARPRVNTITQDRLRQILHYDPATGIFVWRAPRQLEGRQAGYVEKDGYRYIRVDYSDWKASRLAWLYVYGDPIPDLVDHRNTAKDDDRLENLRAANKSGNGANRGANKNNTSGAKGVTWDKSRQKWQAKIMLNGKTINLGRYSTVEEAAEVHSRASQTAFGEFSRTGDTDT
jgi:hypothetical protein